MGRTSDANERLMDAALDLIWEESYGAVSIDDICKRADVKKGSFYYFFASKAELAVAALERMWLTQWKPSMDAQFSPSIDPVQRLLAYLDGIYARQADIFKKTGKVLGCPACCVGSEVGGQEVDLGAKVREIIYRKRRYYESAIRDAVAEGAIEPCDPAQKAQSLMCLLEGATAQARIMNDPESLRGLSASGRDLLRIKAATAAPVPATVPPAS